MRSVVLMAAMVLAGCSGDARRGASTGPADREADHLSGITQMTFGSQFEKAGEAYFSPDSKWVIFQGVPKGEQNYQMYVAPLDWTHGPRLGPARRLTPPNSKNTCGWFSPDGGTILFASTAGRDDPDELAPGYQRSGRNYRWAFSKGMEIYQVPGWRQASGNLATPERRLTDNDAYDAECSYSPEGSVIVFCSDRPSDHPAPPPSTQPADRPKQIWVMNADGSNPIQLTRTLGYNGGPFISPDGRHLLYRADRAGNDLLQIYIADLARDGQGHISGLVNERPITADANVNWGPYWLPDGRHILYATSKVAHTNYEIFARDVTGGGETRITYSQGPDVLPVASPDGRWMMWSSRRGADNTTQIYIARLHLPE